MVSFRHNESKTHRTRGQQEITQGQQDFFNILRLRQNGCHFLDFADKIFKRFFLNENFWISNRFSLKYVPHSLIDNKPTLVQIKIIFTHYLNQWWPSLLMLDLYDFWGAFQKGLNLRPLKFSHVNKMHIFQWMAKIFCVEFQRGPLKFHAKYLSHTLKDVIFIQHLHFKSSWI